MQMMLFLSRHCQRNRRIGRTYPSRNAGVAVNLPQIEKSESMTTGDVESLYAVVCEEYDQKMKSHTTLWKYLKQMEERQIITTRISTITGGEGELPTYPCHIYCQQTLQKDLKHY